MNPAHARMARKRLAKGVESQSEPRQFTKKVDHNDLSLYILDSALTLLRLVLTGLEPAGDAGPPSEAVRARLGFR